MNRIISCLTIALMACVVMNSCEDKSSVAETDYSHNRVIPLTSDAKTASYMFIYNIGHRYSDCQGNCVMVCGKKYHIDCMGFGNICVRATSVTLNQSGTDVTATTTDTFGLTSGDFFLMPDRSLSYTDENNNRIFLNIPEQLLFRDSTTQQFTFTGLFFSDGPMYSND